MLVLKAPAQAWSGVLCVAITSTQLITTHRLVAVSEPPGAPRAPVAHCASLLLTTIQEQHCNFSPAELSGKGGNSTSTSTPSYPEEGVQSMHTGTSGPAVLCPHCPAQGLCKCPATAHLHILLLLDMCLLEIFPRGGGCIRSVFLLFDKLALHISSLAKIN